MSRENVLRFLDKVTRDEAMNRKIADVDATGTAWAGVAKAEGFEFTGDEFREVSEAVLEKKLEGDDFVEALLGAAEGEIGEDDLQAMAGGVSFAGAVRFDRGLMRRVSEIGGGWSSCHVKDGGDPTIGREFGRMEKIFNR